MEARDFPVADGVLVPLLQSATIPASFRHGFSTRAGGVSPAPYHSLNLGSKWGDSPENVAENRRRLLAASGARAMFRDACGACGGRRRSRDREGHGSRRIVQ